MLQLIPYISETCDQFIKFLKRKLRDMIENCFIENVCNNLASNNRKEMPWGHAKNVGEPGKIWGEDVPPLGSPMRVYKHEKSTMQLKTALRNRSHNLEGWLH